LGLSEFGIKGNSKQNFYCRGIPKQELWNKRKSAVLPGDTGDERFFHGKLLGLSELKLIAPLQGFR